MGEITNTEDIIDSRDVIERISEIEIEASSRYDDLHPEGVSYGELAMLDHYAYLDDEDAEELRVLRELASEASDYSEDWEDGATLIRDSYFTEYAQEMAEDCGDIPNYADLRWPFTCIDWERAARELQMDYTTVDFDGVTYWVR